MTARKKTDRIYIHHMVTPRLASDKYYRGDVIKRITAMHKARKPPFATIGYHYVVTGEGEVLPGRDEKAIGAHTLGHNSTSLGVACLGSFVKGGDVMLATDAQYSALCYILARLVQRYAIPIHNIYGHRDGQATECPGQIYDLLSAIRNSVELRLRLP